MDGSRVVMDGEDGMGWRERNGSSTRAFSHGHSLSRDQAAWRERTSRPQPSCPLAGTPLPTAWCVRGDGACVGEEGLCWPSGFRAGIARSCVALRERSLTPGPRTLSHHT